MRTVQQPKAHDGLDADQLGLLHEPLFVTVYRLRGGNRERVPLPNEGQRWTLEQARATEPLVENIAGGGDYEINVVDDKGARHSWRYSSSAPPKPLGPEGPQMAGGFNPFSMFGQMPGAPAGPQQASQVDIPGIGKATTVPGMPTFITPTPTPGNGGKPGEDIMGGTPWQRGGWGQWAPPWQNPWQQPQVNNSEAALRQELAAAKAEAERDRQEARHREEMAEIRRSIEASKQPTGPSPELVEMRANQARLEAELKSERDRSAFEAKLAEERRASDTKFNELREEIRKARDERPKDDPAKALFEFMKVQAETAKAQAEAAERTARYQAEASERSARDQREVLTTTFNAMKADSQTFLPTMMNVISQAASMQSSMTASQMDIMREVLEIKGKDDAPWWGQMLQGALAPLPNIGLALSQGFAANAQAKAAAAMGVPPVAAAQPAEGTPPGRKPRVEVVDNQSVPKVDEKPATSGVETGGPAGVGPEDKIARALIGYRSDVPGAAASYDAQVWGSVLPEIVAYRKLIHDGKMKPKDAAGFLLGLALQKKQLSIEAAALDHLKPEHEELATLIGMALGQAPEGVDPQEYLGFKKNTLEMMVLAVQELQKQAAKEEGGEGEAQAEGEKE
jgi:hypothetical protein